MGEVKVGSSTASVAANSFTISGCTFTSVSKACRYLGIPENEVMENYSKHNNMLRALREVIQDHFDSIRPNVYIYCYCGYKSIWLEDICDRNNIRYSDLIVLTNGEIDDRQVVYRALNELYKRNRTVGLTKAGIDKLHEMGVSDYVIDGTMPIMYNYRLFAKNLIVVEQTAAKLGLTVKEMFSMFHISAMDVYRKMQYNLPDYTLRQKIFSCATPVDKDKTIPDLLTKYGITNKEFVAAKKAKVKNLKGLDIVHFRYSDSTEPEKNRGKDKEGSDGFKRYVIYTSIGNTQYEPLDTFKSSDKPNGEADKPKNKEDKPKEGSDKAAKTSKRFILTTECDAIIDPEIKGKHPFIRGIDVMKRELSNGFISTDEATKKYQLSLINTLRVKKNNFKADFDKLEFMNYNRYNNPGYWIISRVKVNGEVRFMVYDGIHETVKNFSGKSLLCIAKTNPDVVRNIKHISVLEEYVTNGKYKDVLSILPCISVDEDNNMIDEDAGYSPITVVRVENGLVEAYDKFGEPVIFFEADMKQYLKFRGITNVISGEVGKVKQRAVQYMC